MYNQASIYNTGAGGGYTNTSKTLTLDSDKSLDIGEREACRLDVTSSNSARKLTLRCSEDCCVRINSVGADFSLLLKDENGTSLFLVNQYPYKIDYTEIMVYDENGESVPVVSSPKLSKDTRFANKTCFIRVIGKIALVNWVPSF